MFSTRRKKHTRFTACLELGDVDKKLTELRARTTSMQDAAKELNSLSYSKFNILDNFLTKADELIAEFNQGFKQVKKKDELFETMQLLIKMHCIIDEISVEDMEILLSFRNSKRQAARSLIMYGSISTGVTAGALLLGPIGAIGCFFGGSILGNIANYCTGLSNNIPESMNIFLDLERAICDAIRACATTTGAHDLRTLKLAVQEIQYKDVVFDNEVKAGIAYLVKDCHNEFVRIIWRDGASQIQKINLNEFLQENEKYKNFSGFSNLSSSDEIHFNAALLVSLFRFGYSNWIAPLKTSQECKDDLRATIV